MKPYVDRITLVKTNFRDLEEVLRNEVEVDENRQPQVDGILFDLGVSSPQFDEGREGLVTIMMPRWICGWINPPSLPQPRL